MRVHLVSPGFHGYWRAIADALASRGHHVSVHVYDRNSTSTDRVRHHLRHELPRRLGVGDHRGLARQQTATALSALVNSRADAVVVIKGDVLQDPFWDHLDSRRIPRVTWLYDEVRRTRFTPERLERVGPIATYSALDNANFRASGIDSRYLPLAFDHRLSLVAPPRQLDEVTFVGARYPSRETVLLALQDAGVPIRAYGRDWSAHPVDRLRTWRTGTPDLPWGRDLDRAHAYGVMAFSAATLNLHGDQDGFTMRTFEASGVGGVQLIDRADVSAFYDIGTEVLIWSTIEELAETTQRLQNDQTWAAAIRRAASQRTLAEHTFDRRAAVLEDTWDTV